jgi:hypothetical protein
VALQGLLMIAIDVKDVNLRVIKGEDDILLRQVQAGHYTLIRCDLAGIAMAS